MARKLIVVDDRIVGTTTPDDPNGYRLVDPPEGWSGELEVLVWDPHTQTVSLDLEAVRTLRKREVRKAAEAALASIAWRLERAQERERLGVPGEAIVQVLIEREAIRRASNRCEAEIDAAASLEAVQAVTFAVTDADRPQPRRLTRLEFLRRFTDDEMQAIVAAADTSPALKAALLQWQAAEGVVLDDPSTVAGVQALEIAGLIAAGRAQEILA
ncbi:MAG: hypothetical protein KatS3mg124_1837 [Porticoccaceae bacterium]|nr:MAG: hypothetical protein KatS3mg124_1837 [Porticoccaceae bacterium]